MKQWVHKLLEQFDYDWGLGSSNKKDHEPTIDLSEERATILYFIDTYNKHLIEMEKQPVRKVREELDEFAKMLIRPEGESTEKVLFRLRQWFSSYRIDEYSYVHKTFDDFKSIIWDFIDQLGEDFKFEQMQDEKIKDSLDQLKDAVESNSIDVLKSKSREFVDNYIEYQTKRDAKRAKRINDMKKNLEVVRKKLVEANHSMRRDHLTGAFNRMSFDEQMKAHMRYSQHSKQNVTLLMLDIDHFKKINDTYGHDIGDFVLKECVRVLHEKFGRDVDFVARVGGEEFTVLLPDYKMEHALIKVEELMAKVRSDVFIIADKQIKFTISVGIAELSENETPEQWLKRADEALYHSKNTGRDRYTIAPTSKKLTSVA